MNETERNEKYHGNLEYCIHRTTVDKPYCFIFLILRAYDWTARSTDTDKSPHHFVAKPVK